jgi:hypothetical protein
LDLFDFAVRRMAQLSARDTAPLKPAKFARSAAILETRAGVVDRWPTELLRHLGVVEIDTVPVVPGRFYSYMEVSQMRDRLLKGPLDSDGLAGIPSET